MDEKLKESNLYKFFQDLILDMTEEQRTQENKKYDIDKTIENLIGDDQLWQELENAVLDDLVEIEEEV